MREILFKAKIKGNPHGYDGEWIFGNLIVGPTMTFIKRWCKIAESWDTEQVDPETVCQYTGLRDKNGQRIFEGDILKYNKELFEVKFDKGSFCFFSWERRISEVSYWFEYTYVCDKILITGNIHDTTEDTE